MWRKLKLKPKRGQSLTLADGSTIVRQISECHLTLRHGEGHTPVILGEGGDEAPLGVVTLEILGLVFNPFKRTHQPMKMMLAPLFQPRYSSAERAGLAPLFERNNQETAS